MAFLKTEVSDILFFCRNEPFFFWSSVIFYVCILMCVAPGFRRWFKGTFEAPNPSTNSHLAPLDAFRGFAALWVFSYHTWITMQPLNNGMLSMGFVRYGQAAVPVFAVLSGLLIYRSLRGRKITGVLLKSYAKRRFLRIYPLYLVTMIVSVAIGIAIGKGAWGDGKAGLIADVFMLRMFGFPDFCGSPPFNPPSWSLNVEMLFYIALPVWMILSRRRPGLSALAGFVLFAAAGTTTLAKQYLLMKYFFVGIMVCEVMESEWFAKRGNAAGGFLLAAGIALLGLNCAGMPLPDMLINSLSAKAGFAAKPFGNPDYTLTIGFGTALALLGVVKFRPAAVLLSLYPFRFIGIVSYSVYLWHTILIRDPFLGDIDYGAAVGRGDWLTFLLIYMPAVLLYASISYVLIEKTFQKMRPR